MTEPDAPPPASAHPKRRAIAVAISDARDEGALPVVEAIAHGALAERLLEIAFAHGVPVREDADLAEILRAMEAETEIPLAAVAAVAEILSYVYRLNRAPGG